MAHITEQNVLGLIGIYISGQSLSRVRWEGGGRVVASFPFMASQWYLLEYKRKDLDSSIRGFSTIIVERRLGVEPEWWLGIKAWPLCAITLDIEPLEKERLYEGTTRPYKFRNCQLGATKSVISRVAWWQAYVLAPLLRQKKALVNPFAARRSKPLLHLSRDWQRVGGKSATGVYCYVDNTVCLNRGIWK